MQNLTNLPLVQFENKGREIVIANAKELLQGIAFFEKKGKYGMHPTRSVDVWVNEGDAVWPDEYYADPLFKSGLYYGKMLLRQTMNNSARSIIFNIDLMHTAESKIIPVYYGQEVIEEQGDRIF